MPEIITIGEVLVEIMRPNTGQPLDQQGIFYGPYPSGAPAIFAVAAARLGLDVGFIGAVGEDAFGRMMCTCFEGEGIDYSKLLRKARYSTGTAFVAYDEKGSREFVFHIRHAAAGSLSADQLDKSYFENVKWLHISGSTLFINKDSREACLRAVEFAIAQNSRISLDPNLRLELMSLDEACVVIEPFLTYADLLLPTASEALLITGETNEDRAAQALNGKKDPIIIFKRGSKGCSIYHNGNQIEIPGYPVSEIDPTGAGDCFSAAFIAGLEAGWQMEKIGKYANAAGALAVTKMGPMEGLPTRSQVEQIMNSSQI